MGSVENPNLQEMLERINIIQTKGESVKMRNKDKFKITLIETKVRKINNLCKFLF
jgi:hypothetical protein